VTNTSKTNVPNDQAEEWQTSFWIERHLGVRRYRLKTLALEGAIRTRLNLAKYHSLQFNVEDVKAYLKDGTKPRPARVEALV
jgi:hypothetical protein